MSYHRSATAKFRVPPGDVDNVPIVARAQDRKNAVCLYDGRGSSYVLQDTMDRIGVLGLITVEELVDLLHRCDDSMSRHHGWRSLLGTGCGRVNLNSIKLPPVVTRRLGKLGVLRKVMTTDGKNGYRLFLDEAVLRFAIDVLEGRQPSPPKVKG